jgi:hypothetical protein
VISDLSSFPELTQGIRSEIEEFSQMGSDELNSAIQVKLRRASVNYDVLTFLRIDWQYFDRNINNPPRRYI